MNDFYRTRLGQVFFEVTLPRLVAELARLNDLVERGVAVVERLAPPPTSATTREPR